MFFLDRLPIDKYKNFCKRHFNDAGKQLDDNIVTTIYNRFDGVTYYMQRLMNEMFSDTPKGEVCLVEDIDIAIKEILDATSVIYENLMYQLPEKQRMVLATIAKAGIAEQPTSMEFVQKHRLISPSSVKSALPALIDKNLVSMDKGKYTLCDKFLEMWLSGSQ